jgi:hypothetical protein
VAVATVRSEHAERFRAFDGWSAALARRKRQQYQLGRALGTMRHRCAASAFAGWAAAVASKRKAAAAAAAEQQLQEVASAMDSISSAQQQSAERLSAPQAAELRAAVARVAKDLLAGTQQQLQVRRPGYLL